ncbi:hypothetical protein AWB78_00666 [Caballeronia calidae]|uniref:Uncharacterized protein n=1 Tax=Caballeronia calidae TaxID=1777139 RepID=A0A157ZKC4_9BURK|nr:hypothetical protein [Caballeronia calidae]SAK45941.1 hypothetical protein AWB78_00666 [Caballeronia calidae]
MTEVDRGGAVDSNSDLPYFTDTDPALSRSSGGRDPLGLLPVWSAFGRRLVPHIASPVWQINGIKAVVLIQWLANEEALQPLLAGRDAPRNFFRLMEGLIEYWLYSNELRLCFGRHALGTNKHDFRVTIKTGKTVANGLYQYYRGTCRRAGLVDDDWKVAPDLVAQLKRCWTAKATDELIKTLTGPLASANVPLVPEAHLKGTQVSKALEKLFAGDTLRTLLQSSLFGTESQRALLNDFRTIRNAAAENASDFHALFSALGSDELNQDLDYVRRCEPFLLVMQDVFDLLRGSPGKKIGAIAQDLDGDFDVMRERATAFLPLGAVLLAPRMKQMQTLAARLASDEGAGRSAPLIAFVRELVDYHKRCMTERAREPLVLIEGDVIVLPVAGDRDPRSAKKRLSAGTPWMNDYYLNAASSLYSQAFGAAA